MCSSLEVSVDVRPLLVGFPVLGLVSVELETYDVRNAYLVAELSQSMPPTVRAIPDIVRVSPLSVDESPDDFEALLLGDVPVGPILPEAGLSG